MKYIPTHIQIETVNRYCNARCPMCTIKFVPDWDEDAEDDLSFKGISRPAEFMSLESFKTIAIKFAPYVDKIRFLSLHGCGEPLLDKSLAEKIAFAKEVGFKQIGFTSNCSGLNEKNAEKLLEAGLNCIIPSIDGTTKEVLEEIRPRTKFEEVISNVRRFIEIRDKGNYNCKVLVRMVRQQLNINQWDDYNTYWRTYLNPSKGDDVLGFDIHNTGGKVEDYDKKRLSGSSEKVVEFTKTVTENTIKSQNLIKNMDVSKEGHVYLYSEELEESALCPDLFSRLSIFASGDVALCSADQAEYFPMGNIKHEDPIEVFNNEHFSRYRDKWVCQKHSELDYCKDCTISISRFYKNN